MSMIADYSSIGVLGESQSRGPTPVMALVDGGPKTNSWPLLIVNKSAWSMTMSLRNLEEPEEA